MTTKIEPSIERRMSIARAKMLLKTPFWGYLAFHLEMVPKDDLQFGTMATDGNKLFYCPKTVATWTNEQLVGGIAHELGHCAFGHLWRRETRNPMLWNYATDYSINGMLLKEQFILPEGVLFNAAFNDKGSEEIYSLLLKEQANSGEDEGDGSGASGEGGDSNGLPKGNGKPLDDAKMWEEATQGKAQQQGEDTKNERYWAEKVAQAASTAKMQGRLPAHLESLISDILSPKLNWKEILQERVVATIKNDFRLVPPNKRYLTMFDTGPLYLPSRQGEHLKIVVVIDTSGSTIPYQQQFVSEIYSIAAQFDSYEIHYMQCDAQVDLYQVLTLEDRDNWPMIVTGGGGTSFIPPFEKVEEENIDPPLLVYLTDLMGSFPDVPPEYPVLWITTEDLDIPFGEKILFDADA